MDISVQQETGAPIVWGTNYGNPPTYTGYTGRDVVIGIISTGLDCNHEDMRTASGTRVKYLWDHYGVLGYFPPAGFSGGSELTQAQINANPYASGEALINPGQGTHLAGIAAGNGRATGNGKPAYKYIGMAPEADLIIVKLATYSDERVSEGVRYIFTRAASLGKPAVVLIPNTNQRGPHDGSSALDLAISAQTGAGKLVVAPVGDEGRLNIHAKLDLASGATGSMVFNYPTSTTTPGHYLDIEMWHNPTASFEVRLTSPNGGFTSAWIQPGGSTGTILTSDGAYQLYNNTVTSAKSGVTVGKQIRVYLFNNGGNNPIRSGNWTIEVHRLTSTTGRVDAWIADWYVGSGGTSPQFTTNIDTSTCIASPATADGVIAVSAYTTKTQWTQPSGVISGLSDFPTPPYGSFYTICNKGPRRPFIGPGDTMQYPDICAPGQTIASALAQGIQTGSQTVEDGVHWVTRSDMQAAAHVAGALALRLQQIASLTPLQAKNDLAVMAHTDAFTGAVPNDSWGYGKLFINDSDPAAGPRGFKPPNRYYPFEPASG